MYRKTFDRYRLMLALTLPVSGGLLYLLTNEAPVSYAIANGSALLAGLVWIRLGRLPEGRSVRRASMCVLLGFLALPLLSGPHIDGVSRWLPMGSLSVHSGMLVLPSLALLSSREGRCGPWALGSATVLSALQPDAATAFAIAAGSLIIAWKSREIAFAVVAAFAGAGAIYAYGIGDLPPQPFVEGIAQNLWSHRPIQAIAVVTLFASGIWHLVVGPQFLEEEGWALAGVLTGFASMSLIGPYPTPLIGYGVAPILGFALAIGATAGKPQRS